MTRKNAMVLANQVAAGALILLSEYSGRSLEERLHAHGALPVLFGDFEIQIHGIGTWRE